MHIKELMEDAGRLHLAKKWPERTVAEDIALMHSELSEALEEHRNGHSPTDYYYGKGGKPEGIPSEMADVVIRVAQFCALYDIDLEAAIVEKQAFNWTRPERHGGKVI